MAGHRLRRVLFIDPAGRFWGSEQSLLLLIKSLDRQKYEIAACLPAHMPLEAKLQVESVLCYPWFQADLHTRGTVPKIAALVGLLMAVLVFRPDIIHLNQAGAVRVTALVARLLKRPLVIHVRLADDADLVSRRVHSWCSTVCIANSAFVAEQLWIAGIPGKRIHRITNPIEMFDEVSPGLGERKWQVGFVGRLSEDKGIALFLRACEIVIRTRPDTKVVVVGGSGGTRADGQDYLHAMKELARDLGIAKDVEFLGFREDVPELMRQMEVFVMASEAEPWGRVVAEAMVGGASVVAVNSGGPREMIEHEVSGLLVTQGDSAEMAAAILKLLENPEAARLMAAAGYDWVRRECNLQAHVQKIEKVYDRLIADAKK